MPSTALQLGLGLALALTPIQVLGQSLRGSPTSLDRQNEQANRHEYTYLASTTQVRRFVESGYLVPIEPNQDFRLKAVSFPYARPEVKLFVERLAQQYRGACGEPLIVTSLTRPLSRQPRNASDRSVHPTGMAVDLRRSTDPGCRAWLERVLLDLEGKRVLEATRERRPPHYHIAIFPEPYVQYVAQLTGTNAQRTGTNETPATGSHSVDHRVANGESLWVIAQRYGTSLNSIREANGLSGSRIYAGQLLQVPVAR